MKKNEIIETLDKIAHDGIDNDSNELYMFDFVNFINQEVAPHITVKGLNILKEKYQEWVDN